MTNKMILGVPYTFTFNVEKTHPPILIIIFFIERAMLMLTKWAEMEGEGATKEEITYALEGKKLTHVLENVFS